MGYTAGLLKHRIVVQNRKQAVSSDFGLDASGIEWDDTVCLWAAVDWQKGKSALREGAIDAYGVILVRTRWTDQITMRSRIVWENQTYQILPETFHPDKMQNTLQFLAQAIINDK